jgi:hypothetical protein
LSNSKIARRVGFGAAYVHSLRMSVPWVISFRPSVATIRSMLAFSSAMTCRSRYEKGVGSIIELLSAQSALANARQRRVESLLDWRTARLQLAASLGRLNLLALQ